MLYLCWTNASLYWRVRKTETVGKSFLLTGPVQVDDGGLKTPLFPKQKLTSIEILNVRKS